MEKTIVLLHGFGEDHRIFQPQADALARSFKVFAPDLPGSGVLSDYSWENDNQTIEWLADWVYNQLIVNGIKECIMLGHSMGGYITLAFAEKYPAFLRAFGLIHSTAFQDSDQKKETRSKAITFMQEKGGYTFLKTAIPGLFGSQFGTKEPGTVQLLIDRASEFKTESLAAYYRAMMARPDRTHVLRQSGVPVLLVAGSEDQAAPLSDLLLQSAMPRICHFHVLENVGHMGMVEAPENIHDILLNFVALV